MKTFLRPTTDPTTGKPFQVLIPRKGRTIDPAGESLVVDAFLEKRILAGELERAAPVEIVRDPVPEIRPSRTRAPRGDTADEPTTPSTGD